VARCATILWFVLNGFDLRSASLLALFSGRQLLGSTKHYERALTSSRTFLFMTRGQM
jgi:hypothetical protein